MLRWSLEFFFFVNHPVFWFWTKYMRNAAVKQAFTVYSQAVNVIYCRNELLASSSKHCLRATSISKVEMISRKDVSEWIRETVDRMFQEKSIWLVPRNRKTDNKGHGSHGPPYEKKNVLSEPRRPDLIWITHPAAFGSYKPPRWPLILQPSYKPLSTQTWASISNHCLSNVHRCRHLTSPLTHTPKPPRLVKWVGCTLLWSRRLWENPGARQRPP